jgi:hypothetical protein
LYSALLKEFFFSSLSSLDVFSSSSTRVSSVSERSGSFAESDDILREDGELDVPVIAEIFSSLDDPFDLGLLS